VKTRRDATAYRAIDGRTVGRAAAKAFKAAMTAATSTADRRLSIQPRRRWPPSICADRKRRRAVAAASRGLSVDVSGDQRHFGGVVLLLVVLAVPPLAIRRSYSFDLSLSCRSSTRSAVRTHLRLIPAPSTAPTVHVRRRWTRIDVLAKDVAETSTLKQPATSQLQISENLGYRRDAARCFTSLNISLGH